MVAVAVDELAAREGPERISLVLSVLSHHERPLEHNSVMALLVGLLDAEAALSGFARASLTMMMS